MSPAFDTSPSRRQWFRRRAAEASFESDKGRALARRRTTIGLLSRTLAAHATGDPHSVTRALATAEQGIAPLLGSAEPRVLLPHFTSNALVRLAVDTDSDLRMLRPGLETMAEMADLDLMDVGLRTLAHPALLELPLDAAVDAVVGLLGAVAPVQKVSLWLHEPDREPRCLQPGWETEPENEAMVARRAFALETAADDAGLGVATVNCWHRPCAALVFLPEPGRDADCAALAELAAALLMPVFERASLIEGNVARSNALVSSTERRLTRLGYDLHDGALQDLALLIGDLDQLHREVGERLGTSPVGRALSMRIEDAASAAKFLDSDLRDLAGSLDGPTLARHRLDDILDGVVRKFSARSEAEAELDVAGDTEGLTDSQKITLTRVVQEALTNVRDHSRADNVRVTVEAHGSHVAATITDDGCGFDVQECMTTAAESGHMGLAGMVERVRLLGGACEISSTPGAGTTISLTIARWVPRLVPHEPAATPQSSAAEAA